MTTYDIHFQPVPEAEVHGLKMFTFGYETALKVTGPQALVNRWAKTFVTPKGTDPTDLNYGTGFGTLINSNIGNNEDLKDAVVVAIADANTQVKSQDIEGLYAQDERLRDATLTRVEVDRSVSSLQVWVKITNMAGKALTAIMTAEATR